MTTRAFATSCLLLGSTLLLGNTIAAPAPGVDALLHQAVAGSWRSDANKARDQYRHPIETLEFFGLKPDMTVIELSPGGGWYTGILAPVLHDHGQLIEAAPPLDSKSSFMHRMAARFSDKLKSDPAVFGKVKLVPFAPPDQVMLGPDASADMVLTFRNTHDWLNDSPESLAKVFQAAFKVLKKGGMFGVVEHRAKPSDKADAETISKTLHRIPEAYLIALGLKTGFRLEGKSEINANPNDPGDVNVHRLPPDLAGPASEHAKMKAIGESDRMTLKFIKP
ncbi:MAG: class I SAM-dependent methyltransferase [Gammaproteobacteria bacterium]